MTTHLEHIASRIFGQPLLILPSKLDTIARVLAGRVGIQIDQPELGLDDVGRPEPLASRFVGSSRDRESGAGLPYLRTDAGAALITVSGSLVNRGAWIGAKSGLTSYEGLAAQIRAAGNDPKTKSILLDIDSSGGEATGAFELAGLIQAANQAKPVTAFVNGLAASAGYMIASGAGRIISVPSGLTGSIGVVMLHADYSRALDRAGITPTFIYSGSHKVDGNPYEALDPTVKASLQSEVDKMRESFVQLVAQGRGRRMSAKAARDTEAKVYTAAEAKEIGLVDDLASFDTLFDDMNRSAARSRPSARSTKTMTIENEDALAERSRIRTIMSCAEARGREKSALNMALETSLSPAEAASLLSTMPMAGGLAERMRTQSPGGFHSAGADAPSLPTIDAGAIYRRLNSKAGG